MSGAGGAGEAPSDEELVRRAKAGDEAATRVLFDRHVGAFRARVRRGLPSAMRSKLGESDVVQDAYIAAFLKLVEFEDGADGSSSNPWTFTLELYILSHMNKLLIELDDETSRRLEAVAPARSRLRSEFVRTAIRKAIWEIEERRVAEAYERMPDTAADAYLDTRAWEPAPPARRPRKGRR